jgi:hypothetical protein
MSKVERESVGITTTPIARRQFRVAHSTVGLQVAGEQTCHWGRDEL